MKKVRVFLKKVKVFFDKHFSSQKLHLPNIYYTNMITLQNNELILQVALQGAEMQSLKDVRTGYEYLWQRDPEFWNGTSPILFPSVGGHWDGQYRYDGRVWSMTKHGFVRKQVWTILEQSETHAVLSFTPTAEELANYPFPCRIQVTFRLDGRKLTSAFAVENLGESTMYFQMGGHPAFNLPDYDRNEPLSGYITLEGEPKSLLRAMDQGCTAPERFPVPFDAEGRIPCCKETFDNEALIFDEHQVKAATFVRKDGTKLLRIESDAPVWLFWSPQGQHAPFVCPEPWYGLCDRIGFDGELSERPYINTLAAGQTWNGGFVVDLY